MALVNFSIQQTIKPISPNKANGFDTISEEVELVILPKLLGLKMYSDLLANPANYTYLINGCTFVIDNVTYTHRGLKYILAYHNYAKYVKNNHLADTYTGVVVQNRPETTHVSSAELERIANEFQEVANTAWSLTKTYLDNNTTTYPLWSCGNTQVVMPFTIVAMPNNKLR